jgi:hypothetical protein
MYDRCRYFIRSNDSWRYGYHFGGYEMDDLNEAARWYCSHEMTAAGDEDEERDR